MPSTKRRKASGDAPASVDPPAVAPVPSPSTYIPGIQPKLSEVAQLVLVELQKNTEEDVEVALKKLREDILPKCPEDARTDQWKKNKQELICTGAVAMITLTMQKWQTIEKIQVACCKCLIPLVPGWEMGACAIAVSGGIEAIAIAMKSFPYSVDIASATHYLLHSIFLQLKKEPVAPAVQQSARRFVEEFHAIHLLQSTLVGCQVILLLASQKEFQKKITDAGVMDHATAALSSFPDLEFVKIDGRE